MLLDYEVERVTSLASFHLFLSACTLRGHNLLLIEIVACLSYIGLPPFEAIMFESIFLSMFYLCAHVGELVVSQGNTQNITQLQDLNVIKQGQSVTQFIVDFSIFEQNKMFSVYPISLNREKMCKCPVTALNAISWFEDEKRASVHRPNS